jgi:hypothetical protein
VIPLDDAKQLALGLRGRKQTTPDPIAIFPGLHLGVRLAIALHRSGSNRSCFLAEESMQVLARWLCVVVLVAVSSSLEGCGGGGGGGGGTPAVTLTTIEGVARRSVDREGNAVQLSAVGIYSDGTTSDLTTDVTWSTSDPAIVTVSATGLAKGLADGNAELSATLDDLDGSTTVEVTNATLSSIQISPAVPEIARGTNVQLQATGVFSDNSTQDLTGVANWTSSDETTATVSNDSGTKGLASGAETGTATITAKYLKKSATVDLSVTAAVIRLARYRARGSGAHHRNDHGAACDRHVLGLHDSGPHRRGGLGRPSDTSVATVSSAARPARRARGRGHRRRHHHRLGDGADGVHGRHGGATRTLLSITIDPPNPSPGRRHHGPAGGDRCSTTDRRSTSLRT